MNRSTVAVIGILVGLIMTLWGIPGRAQPFSPVPADDLLPPEGEPVEFREGPYACANLCWQLADLNGVSLFDQLRVQACTIPSRRNQLAITVDWVSPDAYQLGGAGIIAPLQQPMPPVAPYVMKFTATHQSSSFGQNKVCGMNATFTPNATLTNLPGTWRLDCGSFVNAGLLRYLSSCAVPAAQATLGADGQPRRAGILP